VTRSAVRQTLSVLIVVMSLALLTNAQAPAEAPSAKQYTGAIQLFISGERPRVKAAEEILTIAKATKFYEAGRLVKEFKTGGKIEYVPREMVTDALEQALTEGFLVNKFIVTGTLPSPSKLAPGTYYVFVDFLDGRWVGRVVSAIGRVECVVPGIQVKQLITYGDVSREAHSRPRIVTHAMGIDDSYWEDLSVRWTPFGNGCMTLIFCIPAG